MKYRVAPQFSSAHAFTSGAYGILIDLIDQNPKSWNLSDHVRTVLKQVRTKNPNLVS